MIRAPKQFVCADCNEIVLHPANQKGFLRRPQGHRVQGFTPRSALLEIAVTLFVALCASGFLIGVGNVATGNATVAATIVSALFAAWAVFLFSRGVKFRRAASPTTLLASQYLASGAGFLFFAILIVCGVTAGVFRW
jgi:hypothetical protein